MHLFLSSENLGNYPEVFKAMVGKGKLAIIENAKDDWDSDDRIKKVNEHLRQLTEEGFDAEEIDLRDYFGKPKELEDRLSQFSGLFVFGGNTFILRRAMAASGIDDVLKRRLTEDSLAYGGSSAGAIVVTPSLRGSEHGDYPDVVPEGYAEKVIWEGVGIVPFYVIPHYQSSWWGEEAEQMKKKLEAKKLNYYALRDGQVIVVNGPKTEVLE